VILPAEPLPGRSSVAPLVQQIAHPILIDERVHGVVVLAVEPRDPHELAVAMRQLQWGMAWLELLLCREHAERDARVIERQRTALDLVASLLDQEHSAAGLSAFAGELATRLECERASVGLLVHGQLRVSVLSRGVDSGRRGKLIRALEAAMEEALDHPEPVVFPAAAGSAAGTVRAHVELARISGSGSIASLPLARGGRAIGVLTVERSAERPIDAAALALCAAVAALAGPVIEIGRRDERSLAVWIADRVRARLRSWRCSLPRWLS
jgi:transcriptional regulator with GAF, ATPase, and Fis domain